MNDNDFNFFIIIIAMVIFFIGIMLNIAWLGDTQKQIIANQETIQLLLISPDPIDTSDGVGAVLVKDPNPLKTIKRKVKK